MNVTADEKLMYEVMKAFYESGIPISFKGSMVLKLCLAEAGYKEDIRHTADIDASWHSDTAPSSDQIKESLQKALDDKNIKLKADVYRMYGENRSGGFEFRNICTGELLFTMDIDVNRPLPSTKLYEMNGIRFRGSSPVQIIADKVFSISKDTVFRRIKDIVDLYYISNVFAFDCPEVLRTLDHSGRTLGDFSGFLTRTSDLQHSYIKFRFSQDITKPDFDTVYRTVREFIKDVLPK